MQVNYIVTLREDVNTGKGVTKLLNAASYQQEPTLQAFVEFTLTDGRTILVNKNNIKSIVKTDSNNENY